MTIGLSTYAFFWQWHHTAENPLTVAQMVDRTADLGLSVFQICDYPLLESYEPDDLDRYEQRRQPDRSGTEVRQIGRATEAEAVHHHHPHRDNGQRGGNPYVPGRRTAEMCAEERRNGGDRQ